MQQLQQEGFRALADPTRRDILKALSSRDLTIAEICDQFPITRTAVKKHLVILEEGHLISVRKSGRERLNHLEPQALRPIMDWFKYFDRFWDDKLSNLSQAIENEQKKENSDE